MMFLPELLGDQASSATFPGSRSSPPLRRSVPGSATSAPACGCSTSETICGKRFRGGGGLEDVGPVLAGAALGNCAAVGRGKRRRPDMPATFH